MKIHVDLLHPHEVTSDIMTSDICSLTLIFMLYVFLTDEQCISLCFFVGATIKLKETNTMVLG